MSEMTCNFTREFSGSLMQCLAGKQHYFVDDALFNRQSMQFLQDRHYAEHCTLTNAS